MTYWLWLIDKYKSLGMDFDYDAERWMINGADAYALRLPLPVMEAMCDRWYGKKEAKC